MLSSGALVLAGLVAGSVTATGVAVSGDDASYTQTIETWRSQRVERLRRPDGWLSLIGLHWLKEGSSRVGSAKDNDLVLAQGPAHLGVVTLADGKVRIALDPASGASIEGSTAKEGELSDDSHDNPGKVVFGTANFVVIDRAGKKGLRVKDSEASTRRHFLGIDYFAIDPSWRIEAKWVPFDPPHQLEVPTVIGTVEK